MAQKVGNYRLIIQHDQDYGESVYLLKGVTRRQALAKYHATRRRYQAPRNQELRRVDRYLRLTGEGTELRLDWF